MHCRQPRAIPENLKPAAVRLLASLPAHGGQGCGVHTKTYDVAKALESMGLLQIRFAPMSGRVVLYRPGNAPEQC